MTNSTSTTIAVPAYEKSEGRRKRVLPTIFPPRHQAYSERLRSAQLKQTFTFELRFYLDIAQPQTLYRAPRLLQPKSFLRPLEGRAIRRRGLTTRPRPLFPLFCERRAHHGSRTPSIDHRTATSQKASETGTIWSERLARLVPPRYAMIRSPRRLERKDDLLSFPSCPEVVASVFDLFFVFVFGAIG